MRLSTPALTLAALLAAAPALAETEFLYDCGADLNLIVMTYPESGTGRLDGSRQADLVPDGQGAWVNEAQEIQFWPEDDEPTLFIGVEQFSCTAFADDPGMNAGAAPEDAAMTNTADLEMTPYGTARGWDVVAFASGGAFAGCGASIEQPSGFLMLQKKSWGWELRLPADRTEGFDGGIITVDGRAVDAQFGFTPEGAGEAALSDDLIRAIANGSSLTTQITGAKPVTWSIAGSAAVIGKIDECVTRQGAQP